LAHQVKQQKGEKDLGCTAKKPAEETFEKRFVVKIESTFWMVEGGKGGSKELTYRWGGRTKKVGHRNKAPE